MSENAIQPKDEILSPEQIATRQFESIKGLYRGIIQGTTVENRREIANHYSWERRKISKDHQTGSRGSSFYRHRKYDPAGLLHNWQTMFDPQNAYDLADEFLISEAGLVRDTLFFHDRWERFNGLATVLSSEEDAEVPSSINPEILANAIELSLKFELLRNKQFDHDLENPNVPIGIVDHHGKLINEKGADGSHRFIQIMEDLDRSLARLATDKRTRAIYFEAINTLAYRTNKKLRRLGIDKGLAQIVGSPVLGGATVVGGIKAAILESNIGTTDPIVRIIRRDPVVPKPHKPETDDTKPQPSPKVQIKSKTELPPRNTTANGSDVQILKALDNISYQGKTGRLEIARTPKGLFRAIFTFPSGNQTATFDLEEGQFLETLADQFNVRPGQPMNKNLGIAESQAIPIGPQTEDQPNPILEKPSTGIVIPPSGKDEKQPAYTDDQNRQQPPTHPKAGGVDEPQEKPQTDEEAPPATLEPKSGTLISRLKERRKTIPAGAIPIRIDDIGELHIGDNFTIRWVPDSGYTLETVETIEDGLSIEELEELVGRRYPGLPLVDNLIAMHRKNQGTQNGIEPLPYYQPPSAEKPTPKPTFRERALRVLRDFLP